MNRLKLLFIGAGCVAVVIAAALFVLLSRDSSPPGAPSPTPTISTTPSVSPTPSLDEQELRGQSTELALAYQNFDSPISAAYAQSLRPQLQQEAITDLIESNQRSVDKAPFLQPVSSQLGDEEIEVNIDELTATVLVPLQSNQKLTGKTFTQTVQVSWERVEGVWQAVRVGVTASTQ